ncbi:DNA polymerase family A-domain-containing protein [Gilbertella persicaria]|uniref:DNA polymerase family A-domain-containing protein n=1 Tax=Gilbertella persicaria TaxID=101096 RepID=UPI00221E5DF8|nr:DNA polymerase family A-domain-containing protein [Gilbertella persicaria]KAI8083387.1 DNA polymerase family A-domain-containing protein [Gilbertella persicaria]
MRLGLEQSSPYLEQCQYLANMELPPMPTQWRKASGWTQYHEGKATPVDFPLEQTFVFDVEVLMSEGKYPTMAVVASDKAWYSWASPYLLGETENKEQLIPFGNTNQPRLVVGHNVGYDRARIAEEYSTEPSHMRFVDTMSLHIAVAGLCSQQRPAWNIEVKRRNQDSEESTNAPEIDHQTKFFDVSSLNSLKDVAKFYCGVNVDKSKRSCFEVGSLEDVRAEFDTLMTYCAHDVALTHNIYKAVFPRFRKNCPHPVSFAGMLHMGNSFLTVTEKWQDYLEKSAGKHQELNDLVDVKLRDLAEKAHALVDAPETWQKDPWLSQLDWFVNPRQRKLKGSPKWYKDAYDTKSDKLKISIRSRIAPLLLRLKWQGYPLHHLANNGWCYKIPSDEANPEQMQKSVLIDDTYCYLKVPHKDGESANCGNPLAKNYIGSFEDKILTSEYEAAREALELNAKSAYWISSRERILNQFVIWDDNITANMHLPKKQEGKYGMILPQMVTMGTVTRRAVEKTWLTASNAKLNRIGSELKSMVQAPEGYKIIGADVDSEELWISSVIGDAQFGFHGATALGWMTLQGTKSEGTDLHSKTASILGISRDKAKIFNYARIYGAGVKYATSLLLQYSQGMDLETAKIRALQLYSNTKGEKEHSVNNPFKRTFWHGGTESYMFNALEDIALSKEPRTPVLGCAITDALKPKYTGTQFLTSRVNWVVQSSGVDYLHLLIVSMAHLIDRYNINARFMLSVHDEVRYLASEKDQHRTALALQVANIWTRALFSYKLGIYDLPQSVAFFSAVDIDHVLRKEPNMTCLTPSHEEKISEGISCSISDTIHALESESKAKECLLGDSVGTFATQIQQNTILELIKKIKTPKKECDLPFLKAQMYKNYRPHINPSLSGNRETERVIKCKDILQEAYA